MTVLAASARCIRKKHVHEDFKPSVSGKFLEARQNPRFLVHTWEHRLIKEAHIKHLHQALREEQCPHVGEADTVGVKLVGISSNICTVA